MKIYASKDDNILTNYDGVITTLTILEEVEVSPIEEKDHEIAVLKKALELAAEGIASGRFECWDICPSDCEKELINQAKKELGGENEKTNED